MMDSRTTAKVLDIRIVAQERVQPVLLGNPIISTVYTLVDWETEEPVTDETFDTLPAAEKRAYELALPRLMQLAQEEAS
jgi:hypothetical protein